MAISSVSQAYINYITSLANNASKSSDSSKSSTTSSSGTDTLDLGSSLSDVSAYLNYGVDGNYSSPSLMDFLGEEDTDSGSSDIFSLLQGSGDGSSALTGLEDSEDSLSEAFEGIIDAKISSINSLINTAISRMEGGKDSDGTDSDQE